VAVNQSHLNAKASIANIPPAVENDRRESVRNLLRSMTCQLKWFMPHFTKDLKLSKKSARWLQKLMEKEMKNERVRI
jgi:hypothetical protein